MSSNEVWVVVAIEPGGASVLASRAGMSTLIERFAVPVLACAERDPKVVHLSEMHRSTAALAKELMAFLVDGVCRDAYEGLVLVVSPAMAGALRIVMDCRVRNLVMVEILEEPAKSLSRSAADFDAQQTRRAAGGYVRW